MFNDAFKVELEKVINGMGIEILVCNQEKLVLTTPINDTENMTIGLYPTDGVYPTIPETLTTINNLFNRGE